MDELSLLHADFMTTVVAPMMLPKAAQLIDRHNAQGDILLIITATNRFVTQPIATALGIENLLATEPEVLNNRYTGKIVGTPCYQEGKITRLHAWLEETGESLAGATFYSDSINDRPLLERVDNAVAVDPDDKLRALADDRNWPIMSLR